MIGIQIPDDGNQAPKNPYLNPSIAALKRLWMNRSFADRQEEADAEANFDALIDSLDRPLPDVDSSPEEKRDALVAMIVRIVELRKLTEDASIKANELGAEAGELFERVFQLAEQLGISTILEKPDKKSLNHQIMEYMIEVDIAVKEFIPVRLAAYRRALADQGLGEGPKSTEEHDADSEGRVTTQTSFAGMNLADQAALQYHAMLMDLASKIASARLEEGGNLDLDEEWKNDAEQS